MWGQHATHSATAYNSDIDLFASKINAQVPTCISRKQNSYPAYLDAFTMVSDNKILHVFPSFSVTGKMLKKIQDDDVAVIPVLLLWPTKVWFPLALKLLAETPFLLPRESLIFIKEPGIKHPQAPRLRMISMILSGNLLKTMAFRRMLPNYSLIP